MATNDTFNFINLIYAIDSYHNYVVILTIVLSLIEVLEIIY